VFTVQCPSRTPSPGGKFRRSKQNKRSKTQEVLFFISKRAHAACSTRARLAFLPQKSIAPFKRFVEGRPRGIGYSDAGSRKLSAGHASICSVPGSSNLGRPVYWCFQFTAVSRSWTRIRRSKPLTFAAFTKHAHGSSSATLAPQEHAASANSPRVKWRLECPTVTMPRVLAGESMNFTLTNDSFSSRITFFSRCALTSGGIQSGLQVRASRLRC